MQGQGYSVRLESVSQGPGGLYEAVLGVEWKGRRYSLRISKLASLPKGVEARLEGDKLVIELVGVGRCEVHVEHLERGCLDCRCLMLPPS